MTDAIASSLGSMKVEYELLISGPDGHAIEGGGYPGQAYRSGFAPAEWFCRTADRIDPPWVCGPHLVLGEARLRRILRSYARYYNDIRTHRSLDQDAPVSRRVQSAGSIRSHPII